MRHYLKLKDTDDVHSLGDPRAALAFPVKGCLCIIGRHDFSILASPRTRAASAMG